MKLCGLKILREHQIKKKHICNMHLLYPLVTIENRVTLKVDTE